MSPNFRLYVYDKNNNLTLGKDCLGHQVKMEYDPVGNLRTVTMYQKTGDENTVEKTVYTYDGNNRISSKVDALKNSEYYEYDANGNLLYEKDRNQNVIAEYEYDTLDQRVAKTVGDGAKTVYCFNQNGQLISTTIPEGTITYIRDELDRIIETNQLNGKNIKYRYDGDGIAKYYDITSLADGTIDKIKRSYFNLECISKETEYTYDGLGNRIADETTTKKLCNRKEKERKEYVLDYTQENPKVLEEINADGTIIKYTYGDLDERISAEISGESESNYTLYTDRLGSTRYAMDANGDIAADVEYGTWGEIVDKKEATEPERYHIARSYTGYTYDGMTGLWNAGARLYSPKDRIFLSKDPEAGTIENTLTMNAYLYCGDNPINNVDPDGRSYLRLMTKQAQDILRGAANIGGKALGIYAKVCCEIDKLPTWSKLLIGAAGIAIAVFAEVGAPVIAAMVLSSVLSGMGTNALFYTLGSVISGDFNIKDLLREAYNGAANGFMFGGIGAGTLGIQNLAKSGKLMKFLGNESGSVEFTGGKGGSKTVPNKANDIANQVKTNNGAAPKGYKGGRTYKNIPLENGAQKLPEGVNYKEYDINPYIKGQNRGAERIVIGDDGSVWYTNDHYYTFTKIGPKEVQ